jgi:type VI protein secretion system component VasF
LTDPNDRRYVVSEYPDRGDLEPAEPPDEPTRPPRRRRTITPLRVTLGIALLVSLGVVGYGLVARDATQLPVLIAGEFISGIVFALLALAGAWASYSRSREGSAGRAFVYAVLGGIAALLAAASLALALILTRTLDS